MAKKKPTAKPKQSVSKVERAKRQLVSNAANKSLAQQERKRAQLKQAKTEAKAQAAFDREYRAVQVSLAKQAGRQAALRDFQSGKKKAR